MKDHTLAPPKEIKDVQMFCRQQVIAPESQIAKEKKTRHISEFT